MYLLGSRTFPLPPIFAMLSNPFIRQKRPSRYASPYISTLAVCCTVLISNAWAGSNSQAASFAQTQLRSSVTQSDDEAAEHLIIRLKEKIIDKQLPGAAKPKIMELEVSAATPLTYLRAMTGDAHVVQLGIPMNVRAAREVARRLARDPRVLSAEVDRKMYPQRVPNDPMYAQQWNYFEPIGGVNMPAAWDITVGSTSIVVAVLDTGILPHVELSGRMVAGYDFITAPVIANDGDGRDLNPIDSGDYGCNGSTSSWHGTHVAGTIGANSNNSSGVSGINWNSKIAPIRVLGRCGGYTSDIVDALRWSAGIDVPGIPKNPTPARVANLSLGGANGPCSVTFQSAINDVTVAGMTVVVAAGNSAADVSGFEPASCNGVIAVAATTRTGAKASYSNFGAKVSVAAPGGGDGQGILSTLNAGTTVASADSYAYYQGTSMATPHVTGVVSLMLSVNPSLTPQEIKQRVERTARPFPTGTGADCSIGVCGAGILDAGAALAGLGTASPTPSPAPTLPPVPSPAPASSWAACATEGGVCNFVGTKTVRYGANNLYATRIAVSSINCNNAVFGDPVPGVVKKCEYDNGGATAPAPPPVTAPAPAPTPAPAPAPAPTTWYACATEGGTCLVPGTTQVRYGASGTYSYKTATSTIACSNAVFGDPSPGVVKSCSYAGVASTPAPAPTPVPTPSPAPAPIVWTDCALENGTCVFTGSHPVRYGANGVYNTRNAAGSIACTNAVFGDPISGIVKACQYSSGVITAPVSASSATSVKGIPLTMKDMIKSIFGTGK